jgi:5-methylcytosine-specific restriction endonuclease McrA
MTQHEDQLMPSKKKSLDRDKMERVVSEARRGRQQREQGYREKALKIFPWICARCGREFEGKKLRELTVHHKDHNHDYNPPDGSNWELLCLYCHDNEHSRYLDQDGFDEAVPGGEQETTPIHKPFANLETLLKKK